MTPPRSPTSSPRIQDSSSNDKKSNCFQCCIPWTSFILVMAGVGVIIYNFIYTIIAIINFSQDDTENVCPNSELWWFALFLGVIWPILASNGAKNTLEKKDDNPVATGACVAFTYLVLMTTFSIWAWDQLYGLPGFANDDCAKIHWQVKNMTEGADNGGYQLYSAVQLWMYIYMSVVGIIMLAFCGIGGIFVVDSCYSKDETTQTTSSYGSQDNRPQTVPSGARRLSIREAEALRLKNLLATGNEDGNPEMDV